MSRSELHRLFELQSLLVICMVTISFDKEHPGGLGESTTIEARDGNRWKERKRKREGKIILQEKNENE